MPKLRVEKRNEAIMGVPNLMRRIRGIADESPTGQVWFRGVQDVEHKLVPSIGRVHWFGGRSKTFDQEGERRLLSRFRRFARQFEGRMLDDWEAMFLARHHGLPVRLMDWTANPLVALYMACEHEKDSSPRNGVVWVLVPSENRSSGLDVLNAGSKPFEISGVRLIDPLVVSPRISAQGGIFTIQEDPWRPLEKYDDCELADDELDVSRLIGFQDLEEHKAARLKELNDLGINRRTLFPDYEGLVRGLVSEEVLSRHAAELNRTLRTRTPDNEKTVTWPARS